MRTNLVLTPEDVLDGILMHTESASLTVGSPPFITAVDGARTRIAASARAQDRQASPHRLDVVWKTRPRQSKCV